ncbi:site-2 protease family protein [Ramlibacter sp. XY19]|uniref:site-2 protease family protein n=1 Tax=Ramlibacter paludis TaxID=2908000 RepID=UPI0023DA6281|nr:site-2 protease family protein [Ramlibacter paludis]MCG2592165.1 site-2 protease family protein [Ramlibacter paludis]
MAAVNLESWIQVVLVYSLPTLFAITLHEVAHGYVARHFGDDTAWNEGRITLNPFNHIDPVGTILFPLMLLVATGGAYALGYARPVPVRYGKLRRPRTQGLWVILAGPACNLLQALAWSLVLVALNVGRIDERFFVEVARAGILVNLAMFAFNLLPVPPLDGGRALAWVLPYRQSQMLARVEPWGFLVVTLLVVIGVVDTYWMRPLVGAGLSAIQALISSVSTLFT